MEFLIVLFIMEVTSSSDWDFCAGIKIKSDEQKGPFIENIVTGYLNHSEWILATVSDLLFSNHMLICKSMRENVYNIHRTINNNTLDFYNIN